MLKVDPLKCCQEWVEGHPGPRNLGRACQNPYAERLVGSVRRECLDHVIVLGEQHLYRILKSYFAYYHRSRTHLSLGKDAPEPRPVHPPSMGKVVALSEVGGLHHCSQHGRLYRPGARQLTAASPGPAQTRMQSALPVELNTGVQPEPREPE